MQVHTIYSKPYLTPLRSLVCRGQKVNASERKVCVVLGQNRTVQRYRQSSKEFAALVRQAVINYATEYGRYGYRAVTDLMRQDGWGINHKRVERIWKQEGLKVPQRHRPRKRLWLNDGSCIRLRPEGKIMSGLMISCSAEQ